MLFSLFQLSLTPELLTGAAGLSVSFLATLLADRRAILVAQAIAGLAFVLHFLLLGAVTGTLIGLLGLIQIAAAYPTQRGSFLQILFIATLPTALAIAAMTWQGFMSALSAGGFILASLGRWQGSVVRMRLFFLAGTLMGAGHNALAGSAFGLGSDALTISGHVWRLWCEVPGRHPRFNRVWGA